MCSVRAFLSNVAIGLMPASPLAWPTSEVVRTDRPKYPSRQDVPGPSKARLDAAINHRGFLRGALDVRRGHDLRDHAGAATETINLSRLVEIEKTIWLG